MASLRIQSKPPRQQPTQLASARILPTTYPQQQQPAYGVPQSWSTTNGNFLFVLCVFFNLSKKASTNPQLLALLAQQQRAGGLLNILQGGSATPPVVSSTARRL